MDLLPKPRQVEEKEGFYELGWNSVIVVDSVIGDMAEEHGTVYAAILRDNLQQGTGITCAVTKGAGRGGDIVLMKDAALKAQEYHLSVTENGIVIAGGDGAAVLYGVQTLSQIVAQSGGMIPCVEITDAPDIKNRGYFFDETRGRILTLDRLKDMVDRISRYKMNQFQLYVEHTYLFRDLTEMWRDETPLTAEDILELDRYCRERHVELVPALASFGHLYMLLSTKSYGDLCERENSWKEPFSFWDRMRHHTLNATDDRALALVKSMLAEYGALFTSNKFNICADETFDLGKEKSKETAERDGVHEMYIRFVNELCTFLTAQGKQPQFFGDIICKNPDYISRLPEDTLCLTWGYAPEQREEECRLMAEAGARQYVCPGVCGWNQWMNLIENSYKNITRMCGYARKYHAEGVLNTDWGDCGHVNYPAFSVPGMIYGACFSWNPLEIGFEEINEQISRLEYRDRSGALVGLMAQISNYSKFDWWATNVFYEKYVLGHEPENDKLLPDTVQQEDTMAQADRKLRDIMRQMKQTATSMDSQIRSIVAEVDLAVEAIRIWNMVGTMLAVKERGENWDEVQAYGLASRVERWFMAYKQQWRAISKEGDLHHIAEIVFWYADYLRSRTDVVQIK